MVIKGTLDPRLRIYLSLLFWILNGEIHSLLSGHMEGWSSSQVLHCVELPAATSSGGRRGQRESIPVESPASLVLMDIWV